MQVFSWGHAGAKILVIIVLSTLPNLALILKFKMAAIAFGRQKNTPALQASVLLEFRKPYPVSQPGLHTCRHAMSIL